MPFRQRVKRALGRDSSSDGSSIKHTKTSDSAKSNSSSSSDDSFPKPKYRRPVDPAHKALMESFSFDQSASASAPARRASFQSQCSPFGSRMPSRNPSVDGTAAGAPWALHLDPRTRHLAPVRVRTGMGGAVMQSADDDASPSAEPASSVPSEDSASDDAQDDADGLGKTFSRDHRPFTEADVTNALMKSMSKKSHD